MSSSVKEFAENRYMPLAPSQNQKKSRPPLFGSISHLHHGYRVHANFFFISFPHTKYMMMYRAGERDSGASAMVSAHSIITISPMPTISLLSLYLRSNRKNLSIFRERDFVSCNPTGLQRVDATLTKEEMHIMAAASFGLCRCELRWYILIFNLVVWQLHLDTCRNRDAELFGYICVTWASFRRPILYPFNYPQLAVSENTPKKEWFPIYRVLAAYCWCRFPKKFASIRVISTTMSRVRGRMVSYIV